MYREYNKYDNIKQAGKSEKENQSMKKVDTYHVGQYLFRDVAHLIDETRKSVAYTVNSALTYMYWRIGKRVNDEILQHERAKYGSQIVATLSQQLQNAYGKDFDKSRRCQNVPQGRHFVLEVSSLRDFSTDKQVRQFAFDIKTDINFCSIVASLMRQSKIKNHQSKM